MKPRRTAGPRPARDSRPSKEDLLAGLDEMAQLRAAILRRRGGQLLPSQAEEISRMREEWAAEMAPEDAAFVEEFTTHCVVVSCIDPVELVRSHDD